MNYSSSYLILLAGGNRAQKRELATNLFQKNILRKVVVESYPSHLRERSSHW